MSKGIDYSKWDKMNLDDDSSSDGTPRPAGQGPSARVQGSTSSSETAKVSIEIDRPQQAEGSAWNVSNFHWEEQNLDKWGDVLLRQMLFEKHVKSRVEYSTGSVLLDYSLSAKKEEELTVEAWSHIRKGCLVCGYNVEAKLAFEGTATGGPKQVAFTGTIAAEAMVDTEAEVSVSITKIPSDVPFTSAIIADVRKHVSAQLQLWASRLQEKGRAVKASKESAATPCAAAATASPAAAAPVALTPTFAADGSRTYSGSSSIQIGGHNPMGKRLD